MGRRASGVRLRASARRPAAWLALAAAATATRFIAPLAADAWPAAALAAGAAVAAAALGSLPREGAASWATWRVAWPVAGAAIGWLAGGCDPLTAAVPATVAMACAATAATVAAAARAGFAPADATGCALAAAAATAAAVAGWVATATPPSPFAWVLPAAACWASAGAAIAWLRRRAMPEDTRPRGPLGGVLPRVAMASALGAMVVFLFLESRVAWGYAAVAAGWLLAVAVPRAALGPGRDGERTRRVLLATAGRRGGPEVSAARVVAAYAAVFAWPPLVAAVLAGAPARPLAIAAAIAALAGTIAALTCGALAASCSRDTAHALALCAAAVAGAGLAGGWLAPANPGPGLMLSNPVDPATLPGSRKEPRFRQSPPGVVSCPASPSPASCRPPESRRRFCSS